MILVPIVICAMRGKVALECWSGQETREEEGRGVEGGGLAFEPRCPGGDACAGAARGGDAGADGRGLFGLFPGVSAGGDPYNSVQSLRVPVQSVIRRPFSVHFYAVTVRAFPFL